MCKLCREMEEDKRRITNLVIAIGSGNLVVKQNGH